MPMQNFLQHLVSIFKVKSVQPIASKKLLMLVISSQWISIPLLYSLLVFFVTFLDTGWKNDSGSNIYHKSVKIICHAAYPKS